MVGAIRKRDIIAHPVVTIDCFGWYVFLRVLVAGKNETFLDIVTDARPTPEPTVEVSYILSHCIDLELKAMRLYRQMADRWNRAPRARDFFANLASQEKCHAEILGLCQAASSHDHWDNEQLTKWARRLPQLEKKMQDAVATLETATSLKDALRLVLLIESSEINDVFQGVVSSNESEFVNQMQVFRTATSNHIRYTCQSIRELESDLEPECDTLSTSFPTRE